ncbi:MAG: hypothetical protein NT026_00360 [Candidatus Staskawiczbacteria bacterium]|nr:hypothetical protein [Candidatus Staskawiczbacteria bacterium]
MEAKNPDEDSPADQKNFCSGAESAKKLFLIPELKKFKITSKIKRATAPAKNFKTRLLFLLIKKLFAPDIKLIIRYRLFYSTTFLNANLFLPKPKKETNRLPFGETSWSRVMLVGYCILALLDLGRADGANRFGGQLAPERAFFRSVIVETLALEQPPYVKGNYSDDSSNNHVSDHGTFLSPREAELSLLARRSFLGLFGFGAKRSRRRIETNVLRKVPASILPGSRDIFAFWRTFHKLCWVQHFGTLGLKLTNSNY